MLYPKEDRENNTLEFACRTCTYSAPAETSCVFRNQLSAAAGDEIGNTDGVGEDPTVGLSQTQSQSQSQSQSQLFDFCTLCGQEIFCEICGQETDRGFWLEVDEDDDANMTGLMTPTSMSASSTPQELATSQQLEQLHLEQNFDRPLAESQNVGDSHSHHTHNHTTTSS